MRLIDADALDMYECLKSYYGDAWRDAQKEIENAPTIDAIPIEWIEDYMERLDSVGFLLNNWRHDSESNIGD